MVPSDENVQRFKKLFKKKYGVDYTDEEAKKTLERLVLFFETLIEIDQREKISVKTRT